MDKKTSGKLKCYPVDAKEAKKLRCCCKVYLTPKEARNWSYMSGACDEHGLALRCCQPAILTLRIETKGGPEFMTFCSRHLDRAEKAVRMLRDSFRRPAREGKA
jgi:hypothetical protein